MVVTTKTKGLPREAEGLSLHYVSQGRILGFARKTGYTTTKGSSPRVIFTYASRGSFLAWRTARKKKGLPREAGDLSLHCALQGRILGFARTTVLSVSLLRYRRTNPRRKL